MSEAGIGFALLSLFFSLELAAVAGRRGGRGVLPNFRALFARSFRCLSARLLILHLDSARRFYLLEGLSVTRNGSSDGKEAETEGRQRESIEEER